MKVKREGKENLFDVVLRFHKNESVKCHKSERTSSSHSPTESELRQSLRESVSPSSSSNTPGNRNTNMKLKHDMTATITFILDLSTYFLDFFSQLVMFL